MVSDLKVYEAESKEKLTPAVANHDRLLGLTPTQLACDVAQLRVLQAPQAWSNVASNAIERRDRLLGLSPQQIDTVYPRAGSSLTPLYVSDGSISIAQPSLMESIPTAPVARTALARVVPQVTYPPVRTGGGGGGGDGSSGSGSGSGSSSGIGRGLGSGGGIGNTAREEDEQSEMSSLHESVHEQVVQRRQGSVMSHSRGSAGGGGEEWSSVADQDIYDDDESDDSGFEYNEYKYNTAIDPDHFGPPREIYLKVIDVPFLKEETCGDVDVDAVHLEFDRVLMTNIHPSANIVSMKTTDLDILKHDTGLKNCMVATNAPQGVKDAGGKTVRYFSSLVKRVTIFKEVLDLEKVIELNYDPRRVMRQTQYVAEQLSDTTVYLLDMESRVKSVLLTKGDYNPQSVSLFKAMWRVKNARLMSKYREGKLVRKQKHWKILIKTWLEEKLNERFKDDNKILLIQLKVWVWNLSVIAQKE